jgi:ribosomal protein L11 methyltransferase
MTDYQVFRINCPSSMSEIVIAELADIGFEGFIENEEGFEAYLVKDTFDAELFYGLCQKYGIDKDMVSEQNIPAQNWNAIWEADFEPIIINDDIVVKAPFHSLSKTYKHEITIQPKNTFGTGHHETTQLVLGLMQSIDFKDRDVFDYGCGTGVLGFFAAQLGAKQIMAIDIDDWSADNVLENAKLNQIDNLHFEQGTLDQIDLSKKYDVILANINKNILVSSFEKLAHISKTGTCMLISGFYESDLQDLIVEAKKHHFTFNTHQTKNTWCVAVFSK